MFYKQIEWQYEQEFRVIIKSDEDTEFIPIDRNLIKAVYLGARIDRDIEKKITYLANQSNIDIFIGITLGDSYKVHFKKPKENTFYSRSF